MDRVGLVRRDEFDARMAELGFRAIIEDSVIESWVEVPENRSTIMWHKVRPCCHQTVMYAMDHATYDPEVLGRFLSRIEHYEHGHGCGE